MPTRSNYYCAECNAWMRNVKSGVVVEEMIDTERPYKLWSADKYQCPDCGKAVIVGFGFTPLVEHFEPDYASRREQYKNELQENFFQET